MKKIRCVRSVCSYFAVVVRKKIVCIEMTIDTNVSHLYVLYVID